MPGICLALPAVHAAFKPPAEAYVYGSRTQCNHAHELTSRTCLLAQLQHRQGCMIMQHLLPYLAGSRTEPVRT